jgi:two-component system alkaline phosphatase synthesis response regulator PhoP
MQKFTEIRTLNEEPPIPGDSLAVEPPVDGAFCDTTKRIVIISPRPALLQTLVAALTERCYDVLLFHHADDPMLPLLQGDLLLIDSTAGAKVPGKPDGLQNLPAIYLVNGAVQGALPDGELVQWPGSPETALARISAAADRSGRQESGVSISQAAHKDIVVDFKRMTVHQSGARIDLTKTEFDLLRVLLDEGGGVLTRQEMMDRVWGDQYYGGSNTVDAHVKSLRSKLGDNPKLPRYIATVRGVGYRLAD